MKKSSELEIGKVVLSANEHSFFYELYTFLISIISINVALEVYRTGKLVREPGDDGIIECKYLNTAIRLPITGLIEGLIKGNSPQKIELDIMKKKDTAGIKKRLKAVTPLSFLTESLSQSMFLNYYEREKELIVKKYGNNKDRWPETWRFAWVIRNSVGHSGEVTINDQGLRPVNWKGLVFSYGNNGQKVLGDILSSADLILLMLDMDKVF